eukprot:105227_1
MQKYLRSIFDTPSTRSNVAIEGVRTVLMFIVLIHHIDILNPNLLKQNNLWTYDADIKDLSDEPLRRLLKFLPLPKYRVVQNIWHTGKYTKLSPLGLFIYVFNGYLSVTIFLILSGYILSFQCFKRYAFHINSSQNNKVNLFPKWLYNLITLSIKRSLKFIIPLFVIQISTFLLWYFQLINIHKPKHWIRAYKNFNSFYDKYFNFDMLFFNGPNGALWIMKELFFAPLIVIPVVLTVIFLKSFQSRFCVYIIYAIIYFDSPNFPILLGVILADLLHLDNYNGNSKVIQFYFKYKFMIPIVSFCFLFIKKLLFQNCKYIIDYNLSITFRSIIWFNIALVILG